MFFKLASRLFSQHHNQKLRLGFNFFFSQKLKCRAQKYMIPVMFHFFLASKMGIFLQNITLKIVVTGSNQQTQPLG